MILNDKNLPYNVRTSEHQVIVEMKPLEGSMPGVAGETFNLGKLTPQSARKLAIWLEAWADEKEPSEKDSEQEVPGDQISANNMGELTDASALLDTLKVPHYSEDNSHALTLSERIALLASSSKNEPISEENHSSDTGDENNSAQ